MSLSISILSIAHFVFAIGIALSEEISMQLHIAYAMSISTENNACI